jgi:hypothetical protein
MSNGVRVRPLQPIAADNMALGRADVSRPIYACERRSRRSRHARGLCAPLKEKRHYACRLSKSALVPVGEQSARTRLRVRTHENGG